MQAILQKIAALEEREVRLEKLAIVVVILVRRLAVDRDFVYIKLGSEHSIMGADVCQTVNLVK